MTQRPSVQLVDERRLEPSDNGPDFLLLLRLGLGLGRQ